MAVIIMEENENEVLVDLRMKAVSILYRLVKLHMKASSLNRMSTHTPVASSALTPPISRANVLRFAHESSPPSLMRRGRRIDPLPHVVRANNRLIDTQERATTPPYKSHSSLVHLPQLQFTSDVIRSARLHRAKSPPRVGVARSKHTRIPPSSRLAAIARRTSSNSLTPLPLATGSSVTLSSQDPYYEETGEIFSIAPSCLPRRPLIHCHQRSPHSETHRLIRDVAKRNRRPITPPWSSILKEGLSGVHEDILVSYYNTTPKAVDGIRRYNRESVSSRAVFPDTTHGPDACSVHTSKLPGHQIPPTLSDREQREQSPRQVLQGVGSDHSNGNKLPAISRDERRASNIREDCGKTAIAAPPPQVQERERAANKESEKIIRELPDSGVQETMKGMKQDESARLHKAQNAAQNQRFRDQVTFTVSCFDDDLAADNAAEPGNNAQRQRQRRQPNTVDTCVSIVIDPVEEEQIGHLDELNEQIKSLAHPTTPDSVNPVTEDPFVNPEIKLQSILDYVKIRRHEFAKLLEEHAEIVHEINKFEGGVTS